MSVSAAIASLATYSQDELLSVIETPKGSRNKYGFNENLRAFTLKKVLPRGMLFPYDFGFIPATEGEDGDPLDVLVLLDEPAPMGCVVPIRAIGAIEAKQRQKKGGWLRNDRLIAVATHAKLHSGVSDLKEINPQILDEIEAFFRDYNEQEGKDFKPLKRCGPKAALRLIDEGRRRRRDSDRSAER